MSIFFFMDSAQACDLTNIFEELSQIEKFSEIKPPLVNLKWDNLLQRKPMSYI